jgi:hypothetical protein
MIIYLYVKQHSITGLKYFGKTTKSDPFKYLGSGKIWCRHIKKHGKEYVKTLEIWGFDDQKLCEEFALKFSEDNDIVKSKLWANLMIENSDTGGPCFAGHFHSLESKQKLSINAKARKINPMQNKKHTDESKKIMSEKLKGRIILEETKSKMRGKRNKYYKSENYKSSMLGKTMSDESRKKISISKLRKQMKISTCPHCNTTGGGGNMTRYHFNNCKFR